MFILFLIPGVPKDLLCYVAGLTAMHALTFLAISTVGRFPGVLLSCLFGAGLAERDWRMLAISGVAGLALLALAYAVRGPLERFRQRHLMTRREIGWLGSQEAGLGGATRHDGSIDGEKEKCTR
jgi:uncharacterized membrane protein YdjX (TVP38/TMEM64 family)